jgi:hypothetical protein
MMLWGEVQNNSNGISWGGVGSGREVRKWFILAMQE